MPPTLTARETEIMTILWDRGPSTVLEVRDFLDDARPYTTVLSMLRTLEVKGYLRHDVIGRAHRYTPLVARDMARRSALRELTKKLYKGSTALLVAHFLSDRQLTQDEAERLHQLIAERTRPPK